MGIRIPLFMTAAVHTTALLVGAKGCLHVTDSMVRNIGRGRSTERSGRTLATTFGTTI